MNVFKIEPTTSYSGGIGLVAARDLHEAIKVFCEDEYRKFEFDEYICTCNIILGLDFDTQEPKVIINSLMCS